MNLKRQIKFQTTMLAKIVLLFQIDLENRILEPKRLTALTFC